MMIFGAGILGEIVLEAARRASVEVEGFLDDTREESDFAGLPVFSRLGDFQKDGTSWSRGVFVAVGENRNRKKCVQTLVKFGVRNFPNIIDPEATVFSSATVGEGNLILPGAVIGPQSVLGSWNIFFPGVCLTHHNAVKDFCFFGPNASVGGYSTINDFCKLGMNSVVPPFLDIPSGTVGGPLSIIDGNVKY